MADQFDRQDVEADVLSYLNSQSEEKGLSPDGLKKEFCNLWPEVKKGLEVVKNFVPGTVKVIIGIVITAGDVAYGAVCK